MSRIGRRVLVAFNLVIKVGITPMPGTECNIKYYRLKTYHLERKVEYLFRSSTKKKHTHFGPVI